MIPMRFDDFSTRVFNAVNGKSDRDCVICFLSWIDYLLQRKLNSLPPPYRRTPNKISSRIDAAFQAGLIDTELRDDLHRLRKLRNEFAHSIDVSTLDDKVLQETIRSLQVPQREYHDWNQVSVAARPDGSIALYTGNRPEDATEDLSVGCLLFKIGISVIFSVLVVSLNLEFAEDEMDELFVLSIPSHLMIPSSKKIPS